MWPIDQLYIELGFWPITVKNHHFFLEFFKNFHFFVILAYELHNKNLILENFDDFFFWFFFLFFEKFWMIPNDKYTWEGQIFILRYFTWSFCITSSLKVYFLQIWWLSDILGYFHKVLAISCTIVTRYDLFDSKFEFCDWF